MKKQEGSWKRRLLKRQVSIEKIIVIQYTCFLKTQSYKQNYPCLAKKARKEEKKSAKKAKRKSKIKDEDQPEAKRLKK